MSAAHLFDDYDPFDDGSPDSHPVKPGGGGFQRFQPKARDGKRDLVELVAHGDPEVTGNIEALKPKKGDHTNRTQYLYKKTKELFEKRGYFYQKVECWTTTYTGMAYKQDFGGFADSLAIKGHDILAVQITTLSKVGEHIREMLNPKTDKRYCGNVRSNALKFMAVGGRIIVLGWHQNESGKWECDETEVTEQMIELYDGRRRK